VSGSFPEPLYAALLQDRPLLIAIVQQLLNDHFPSRLHGRLLDAVGLAVEEQARE